MNCNNCNESFDEDKGIVIKHEGRIAAAICPTCCRDVRVGKVVLRRGDLGGFAYDQWSPMEQMRGGLTSKRAG